MNEVKTGDKIALFIAVVCFIFALWSLDRAISRLENRIIALEQQQKGQK